MSVALRLVVLATVLAPAAAADFVNCPPGVPPGVECVTGFHDDVNDGALESGKVYHLSGLTTVPAGQTLTIQSGAILKFHPTASLAVRGTLDCGAAIFTSLADDTAGGDTNGDGPSAGMPGDWGGLSFFFGASAGSVVDGAEIRFGTTGVIHFGANNDLANVTHRNVVVTSCSFVAWSTGLFSQPTATNCTFENSRLAAQANISALPGMVGNSASGNQEGDCIEIIEGTVKGSVVIGPQNSLDGRPFAVCPSIVVQAGTTLDLQPGTTLKFGAILGSGGQVCDWGSIIASGTLLCDGVVITSLEDDTIGGDLNKDGPTFGTPGNIGRLIFQATSDASVVRNTLFRFGGFDAPVPQAFPAIELLQADVVLEGVDVTDCSAAAVDLNIGVNSSFPTVTGCSFTNNLGAAVVNVPIDAVSGFTNNTASGNLRNAIEIGGGFLPGFAAVDKDNSLNDDGDFIVRGTVTLNAGAELALGAGVALKWQPGVFRLDVIGILTATGTPAEPVILTTLTDDATVGDTNNDGATTQPAPGDWVGVRLNNGSGASLMDGVVVRYAGSLALGAVDARSNATMKDTVVELSETAGLAISGSATPSVVGCTFRDNGGLAVSGASIRAVAGFSGCFASGNALGDFLHVVNGDASFGTSLPAGANLEIGPDNTLAPGLTLVVDDNLDVPSGYQLSVLGGTLVKFLGNRELDVDGTVQIGGDGGGTAVFTTTLDDSVGGDTLKDGSTQGAPGAWQGLVITGPGSSLEDVLVRFAGAFGVSGQTGILLQGANTQLEDVRVEDCLGAGLHLGGNSLPLVGDCSFDRNDIAVDGVPIKALPGFSSSTATDNKVGDYQRITDGTVLADLLVQASMAVNGGVFVVANGITVAAGGTLTLDPNTTFKDQGDDFVDVDGVLIVHGPVTFTTLTDDINGDTNEDMGATTPVPGSWKGFSFTDGSDASVLQGIRVRYAGSAGGFGNVAAVDLNRANITILDSRIELSASRGLQLVNDARPTVLRTAFDDNEGIPVNGVSVGAIGGFEDNTATGNLPGDYMRVTSSTMGGDATVSSYNALNGDGVFVVATSVQVVAPDTLSLHQGVRLKFDGSQSLRVITGSIHVAGTGLEPVVLTSVDDDEIGGDTRKDGTATTPAPGDWRRFEIGFQAGASTVEHLVARYGGLASIASIELLSDLAHARSLRAEFALGDGIRGSRLASDATNWVAFGCNGDGIEIGISNFDLVHATAAGNGGVGIRKVPGHAGSLWNAISFDNGGTRTAGFVPGEVFFSDVDAGFSGFDGNISADPLFVDAPNGDLGLAAGSPCIDAADLGTALLVAADHREASRVLDDDLDGAFGADMGAFERAHYELIAGGSPRLGTTMSFTTNGTEAGVVLYFLGFLNAEFFLPPFGFGLIGTPGTLVSLGARLTGVPRFVTFPVDATLDGLPFGVQGLAVPFVAPALGNMTNRYRGELYE